MFRRFSIVINVWMCLAGLLVQNGWAQHFDYKQFDTEQGMPSNETYMVYEDTKGYIWIGTDRGLVRYNGYEFETFTTKDGLPDNTIFDIKEAPDGSIWFITFNKKIGNYKNGKFTTFLINSEVDFMTNVDYYVDLSFSADTIVAKTPRIQYYYLPMADSLHFIRSVEYLPSNIAKRLGKLHRYAYPDSSQLLDWSMLSNQSSLHHGYTNILRIDDSTSLVVSGALEIPHNMPREFERLVIYNERQRRFTHGFTLPDKIGYIQRVKGKILFSVSKKGIYEYLPETHEIICRVALPYEISGFTIDKDDILWVSTLNSGILKITSRDIGKDAFFDGKILQKSFTLDRQYVLSNNDLYARSGRNWEMMIPKTAHRNSSFRNDMKRAIIATSDGSTFQISMQGMESHFRLTSSNSGVSQLDQFFQKNDRFYMLTYNSISVLQAKQMDSVVVGLKNTYPRTNLQVGNLRIIADYDEEHVLIGGLRGLFKYNITDGTITSLEKMHPLLGNRITEIQQWSDGTQLLTSIGGGIIVFHPDTIYAISTKNGLLSNQANNLIMDQDSLLWVSCNEGVNRIRIKNMRKGAFIIDGFTADDGLSSRKVNFVNVHGDSVYVCTDRGLNVFHKQLKKKKINIPIYFNSIQINKKDTALYTEYELSYNQNVIDIYFTGISTRHGENIMYKYRLNREDNHWNYTSNRSIQLLSLPPDRYDLEIYAITPDGTESEYSAKASFIIHPPFWLTWWFITLCVLLALSIVWYYVNERIARIRKDAAIKLELHKLENKALSSQLNPHFIFNALTAIQHYILKKDRYAAYDYLTQFATLVRAILKNSEDEYVLLSEETELLKKYLELETIRFHNKFEYRIEIAEEIEPGELYIPSMLVQPYAENAIRHGLVHKEGAGVLKIAFFLEQKILVCVIEDDGVGREKAKELTKNKKHRSFAMGINQRRLQLLNEVYGENLSMKIEDLYKNDEPAGTKVTLFIPINPLN